MAENDTKPQADRKADKDPFSIFMFGNNVMRDDGTQEAKDSFTNGRVQQWSDDWFWGNRNNSVGETQSPNREIENILNQVDFDLLMETIDMFVITTKQFKPLWKEFKMIFNQFSKKTESK